VAGLNVNVQTFHDEIWGTWLIENGIRTRRKREGEDSSPYGFEREVGLGVGDQLKGGR